MVIRMEIFLDAIFVVSASCKAWFSATVRATVSKPIMENMMVVIAVHKATKFPELPVKVGIVESFPIKLESLVNARILEVNPQGPL